MLARRYVGTSILSPQVQDYVRGKGIKFAKAEDAAGAMMRIASDPSVNGKWPSVVDVVMKVF
jgi:hypothetical protein